MKGSEYVQTYQPITALKLENFMSVAYAEIPVGKILSLCGYNDQGKSAVRTALEVLLYDAYSTEQARYIKDGTDYFRVTVAFADNVVISKEKRIDGNSIWNMSKDGTTLYTNVRDDGAVVAVEDVPECIATYFGVYYDENTKQELNIRKDRDPYFLVDSSGGDNYKLLNPLLHSEALSRASELMLKDSNACKAEYDTAAVRLSVVQEQLAQKDIVPPKLLDKLDTCIANVQNKATQQELVENVNNAYMYASTCKVPPEVQRADESKLNTLQQIIHLKQTADVTAPPVVTICDGVRLDMLQQMHNAQKQIAPVYDTVKHVDTEQLNMLDEMTTAATAYTTAVQQATAYDTQIADMRKQLKQMTDELAAVGYVVCPNCGSLVGEDAVGVHTH